MFIQKDQVTNQSSGFYGNSDYIANNERGDYSNEQGAFHSIQNSQRPNLLDSSSNDMSSSAVLPPVTGLASQTTPPTLQTTPTIPSSILGSTPLSLIGCPPLNLDQYSGNLYDAECVCVCLVLESLKLYFFLNLIH